MKNLFLAFLIAPEYSPRMSEEIGEMSTPVGQWTAHSEQFRQESKMSSAADDPSVSWARLPSMTA